ncbi:hypothetical protein AQS8620_00914 [Aquimixticola soesokkakensis]|uniref:Uncharacterized protein n=1 Tax=Aquimixticola soesokkakensis TaxID=1519096 RepID=A0A1Y5S0S5_9RHOB|nr:hypothetical protein [Aquimixticola soesokkakensis]SLN29468.1 hypothetical protein AQS8620_00914 [Aquimixticola soesokkakensis]
MAKSRSKSAPRAAAAPKLDAVVFQALALAQSGAVAQGTQRFFCAGRCFATVESPACGRLNLSLPQQALLVSLSEGCVVCDASAGEGWTQIDFAKVDLALIADFVAMAARGGAPQAGEAVQGSLRAALLDGGFTA